MNPYIDLPKVPTLPHNYASIPSTLPPSILQAPPAPSAPDLPAYVTSQSGFAAHTSVIIAQNEALLEQLDREEREAIETVQNWKQSIEARELAEKRRKAPGWLDSEARLLEPKKAGASDSSAEAVTSETTSQGARGQDRSNADVDTLGRAMDRAFGTKDND